MDSSYSFYHTFKPVFILHLIGVILIGVCIVLCQTGSGPFEAPFLWAIFLLIDFPCSIIVFVTGGVSVVGIPEYYIGNWFVCDVLWPSVVFQFVGTINWFLILGVYHFIKKRYK
jgi:hypothetical protein